MELRVLPERLAVCRVTGPWPTPTEHDVFFAVIRTAGEVTLVCAEDSVPDGATVEPDWRAFEVSGPLEFTMVGVLAAMTASLAQAEVSVFVLSSFDTDYLLVHASAVDRAVAALRAGGHTVRAA